MTSCMYIYFCMYMYIYELLRVDHGQASNLLAANTIVSALQTDGNCRLIKDRTWPSQSVLPVVSSCDPPKTLRYFGMPPNSWLVDV